MPITIGGIARLEKGELRAAISDFDMVIEIKPADPEPYHLRGDARFMNSDMSGAIADYTRAIEIKPDSYEA